MKTPAKIEGMNESKYETSNSRTYKPVRSISLDSRIKM
jgi:hypothetical protein